MLRTRAAARSDERRMVVPRLVDQRDELRWALSLCAQRKQARCDKPHPEHRSPLRIMTPHGGRHACAHADSTRPAARASRHTLGSFRCRASSLRSELYRSSRTSQAPARNQSQPPDRSPHPHVCSLRARTSAVDVDHVNYTQPSSDFNFRATERDPAWVCGSGAFGRIHPRDPERFPLAEALIDGTLDVWHKRMQSRWGFFGFVDYNAGPLLQYFADDVPRLYRFVRYTYSLRSDLWMQYARSGDRRTREFAEATNRAYLDNVYTHWDSSGKTAGLPHSPGGDEYPQAGSLPLYWNGASVTNQLTTILLMTI